MPGRYVAYYRVSTQKQGASGLGIDAQKRTVKDYLLRVGGDLVGTFQEIESGKRADRPELQKAMELCELTGARLLIAKLDRLSRNVHFMTGLAERGVLFVACDNPSATELTVNILASVAQEERKAISLRTSAALSSIKSKLVEDGQYVSRRSGKTIIKLGNPNGLTVSRPDLGLQARREKAYKFYSKCRPLIQQFKDQGLSLSAIAQRLTDMKIKTPRGHDQWSAMTVKRAMDSVAAM